jgi:hypothetical protein
MKRSSALGSEPRSRPLQPQEGLDRLAEAAELIETTQERCIEPEMHRVRGTLLLSMNERDAAEDSYCRSLAARLRSWNALRPQLAPVAHPSKLPRWVTENGGGPTAISIRVEECRPHDPVLACRGDREGGLGVFDMDRLRVPIARQANGEVLGGIEHPGIGRFTENSTS